MPPVTPLHRRGAVTLVGAGPGHPDLLTVRGLRALQAAEVVLHDALLHPDFRALFPEGAEVVDVGKRCGAHGASQEAIHGLLLDRASRGLRVVRLKGGDPFLFGRGGEEVLALRAAGIPVEVVPGVSSLTGAGAAAGIPLTHRGLSREVRILEGHGLLDRPRDWAELARFDGTVAVFMGKALVSALAARLLEHGAPPERPLALVENAWMPGMRVTRSTLGAAALGFEPCTGGPGLLYLGPTIDALPSEIPHELPAPPLPEPQRPPRPPRGGRLRRAG